MHISEIQQPSNASNTILTKCSKMTEEGHRRHGMNGNADGSIKEEFPKNNYVQGGRLKFFKDGKFILELESAREGERISWVSVPRKTFWPPQGTAASTPTYRQESSTSLSVSDDNSSIQSSPWQRDHSWKQTTPRRRLSKEMTLYFWRPKQRRSCKRSKKRRRPYSTAPEPEDIKVLCSERTTKNKMCNNTVNSLKSKATRHSLLAIVQTLIEKISRTSTPPRAEMVISPRKRFLREMEKDKIQMEDNCQKRSRNKPQIPQAVTSPSAPVAPSVSSPVAVNGTASAEETSKLPRNCSYSITSLLAEDRNIRRSPSNSPSHFTSVTQPQYCSPSSDDRWYSESVDRLQSIALSHVEKRSGYPQYPHHQSFVPPYIYPYPVPSYYNAGIYNRQGYVMPPMYHTSPIQAPVRHETPSYSWPTEPPGDIEHRDESVTDMPLNLSKHAG